MKHEAILVTGGAGFVGSNLALMFKRRYPHLRVIVMDNLRRRGSELNIARLAEAGIKMVHGDVRCREDFPEDHYSALIECSAEPSVLAGFDGNPFYVINTNLIGTINCLEDARKHKADIIFLSSSRVYPYDRINAIEVTEGTTRMEWQDVGPIVGWSQKGITEQFPLEGPRSLYGASKLCSEYLLQEYISMYGLRGVINRCGVIAGPWQFGKVDQGVFTLWMLAHYFKRQLKYIGFKGTGKQVRDLLHVDDLFELVDLQLASLGTLKRLIYNVGGGAEVSLSLRETTRLCEDLTGNVIHIEKITETRPADLAIYLTDASVVREELGWQTRKSARQILENIYVWVRENEKLLAQARI